jgi:hypothetical protein
MSRSGLLVAVLVVGCGDHDAPPPAVDAPAIDVAVVDVEPVQQCDYAFGAGQYGACPIAKPYCCIAPLESFTCEPTFRLGGCAEQPVTATETRCNPMNGAGCSAEQPICCGFDAMHRTYCSDHVLLGGWTCST